jgi:hypothetical protein
LRPLSPTIDTSPKSFDGPVATASLNCTSIPSMLSWKSIPSCCGSKIGLVSTSPIESLSMNLFGGIRPP